MATIAPWIPTFNPLQAISAGANLGMGLRQQALAHQEAANRAALAQQAFQAQQSAQMAHQAQQQREFSASLELQRANQVMREREAMARLGEMQSGTELRALTALEGVDQRRSAAEAAQRGKDQMDALRFQGEREYEALLAGGMPEAQALLRVAPKIWGSGVGLGSLSQLAGKTPVVFKPQYLKVDNGAWMQTTPEGKLEPAYTPKQATKPGDVEVWEVKDAITQRARVQAALRKPALLDAERKALLDEKAGYDKTIADFDARWGASSGLEGPGPIGREITAPELSPMIVPPEILPPSAGTNPPAIPPQGVPISKAEKDNIRAEANKAIKRGAPPEAVRARFKQMTGEDL